MLGMSLVIMSPPGASAVADSRPPIVGVQYPAGGLGPELKCQYGRHK